MGKCAVPIKNLKLFFLFLIYKNIYLHAANILIIEFKIYLDVGIPKL